MDYFTVEKWVSMPSLDGGGRWITLIEDGDKTHVELHFNHLVATYHQNLYRVCRYERKVLYTSADAKEGAPGTSQE